MFKKVFLKRRK